MVPVRVEYAKGIHFLKSLARIGFVTEDNIKYFDIGKTRLYQHISSNNVFKRGTYLIYGQMNNIYKLTEDCRKRMAAEFSIHPYETDVSQLEHDYVLGRVYCYLSMVERETWKTETDIKFLYPEASTVVDGIYTSQKGLVVGVEIITDNYSKKQIEEKKEFIRHYCDDYIMIHNHKDITY